MPPVHNSIYVGDLDPKAMARNREFTVALGRQDIKITYLFHRWAQSVQLWRRTASSGNAFASGLKPPFHIQ